ncbi:MAG: DNA translocase FtsK [Bacteroidota bacterium]|nr:DNA translocase FtsK [Bacteroidota bacterium]
MASDSNKKNSFKGKSSKKETVTKSSNNSKKKKRNSSQRKENIRLISGIFLILFSVYLFVSFTSYFYNWFVFGNDDAILNLPFSTLFFDSSIEHHNLAGSIGAYLSNVFIYDWFGISSFLFCFYLFILGVWLSLEHQILPLVKTLRYTLAIILCMSLTTGYLFQNTDIEIFGGTVGVFGVNFLQSILGVTGTGIVILFYITIITTIAYNIPLRWINVESFKRKKKTEKENTSVKSVKEKRKPSKNNNTADNVANSNAINFNTSEYAIEDETEDIEKEPVNSIIDTTIEDNEEEAPKIPESKPKNGISFTVEEIKEEEKGTTNSLQHKGIDTEYDPTLDLPHYKFPTFDLLDTFEDEEKKRVQFEELEANKKRIVESLSNYAIKIVSIKATPGPSVTLYEIIPAAGIRVSKIKNLEDDIAMSLAANGIRIIAPIPGKGTIGIEVPNKNPQIVSMRSILSSKKFSNCDYELPIALGKTISNESFITDLAKMPHLLIAGATGQGKSVGLNSIIASLLYKKHPATLKFVLIDPKKVELSLYNKIERHFLAKLPDNEESIVTETQEVVRTLNSLVIEMESRYNLLKNAQVKSIKEYNTKFVARKLNPENGHKFLPYIVLIIDEFADLIMTSGKETELPITRLAQLSRAIGIHLIIATQRPSVNIITGSIKANFPARIAFRVISKFDSRTILDYSGAEQLVGRGDMLLSTGKELERLQGAFIDSPEIDRITEFIGSQRAYPTAFDLPEYVDEKTEHNSDIKETDRDELFEDAAKIVVTHQHGSTSLIQRKLKLGYNRAGRIIDQLEAVGIVGHFEGSKAREVRISDEIALEQFLEELRHKN